MALYKSDYYYYYYYYYYPDNKVINKQQNTAKQDQYIVSSRQGELANTNHSEYA